jgi:hypothetical protein
VSAPAQTQCPLALWVVWVWVRRPGPLVVGGLQALARWDSLSQSRSAGPRPLGDTLSTAGHFCAALRGHLLELRTPENLENVDADTDTGCLVLASIQHLASSNSSSLTNCN